MNLEEVIKEYEQLQTSIVKTDSSKKGFPHIVSKDSFERMIMTAEDYANRSDAHTPPPNGNSSMKLVNVIPQTVQQTSVITANNSVRKSSTANSRKLSVQRQQRFDDSIENTDTECSSNEKNYVIKESDSESPKVLCKSYNVTPPSFDNYTHYENRLRRFGKSRSHSSEHSDSYGNLMYDSGEQLSKIPAKGSDYPLRLSSKQQSYSFESDDQTAHYMKGLHISPTQHYYQDPYGSLHSSSRESLIESPTNSIRNSSNRRSHDSQYDVLHDSVSPVVPPNPASRSPNCRSSYDSQHNRQYKYCQRRAISLNTAPYHQLHSEQNLRRILSEEIVAENPLINCMRRAESSNSKLRRAASYDTFDDFARDNLQNYGLDKERQTAIPLTNQTQPPTKIIFPEHANIKDHNKIFTQVDDDDGAHLISINRLLEKSQLTNEHSPFTSDHLPFTSDHSLFTTEHSPFTSEHSTFTPEHSPFTPEHELNYRHTPLLTNYIPNTNITNQEIEIKNEKPPTTKGKTNKSQYDNFTIGPYEYDSEKDDEVAVCVSGLLTLPGSNEKRYPISVGELRRRIAPPEYLNKVDMISYVRLAKTSARELLEKYEIRPKHHSRKSKHSVISKMCEAECAELANGINILSDAYFPEEWLAQLSISSKEDEENDEEVSRIFTEQKAKVEIARSVLQDFSTLLETKKSAKEMQDYNLATHSYGLLNLKNNIKLITSFLECQNDILTNKIDSSNDTKSASIHGARLLRNAMDTDIETSKVDNDVEKEP